MRGQKHRKVLHTDSMQYVSIHDTLQMLLQNKSFISELNFDVSTTSSFDFSDGALIQNHPVVKANPHNCLLLVAYYDEVPLGTNVKKHKVGCVFFTLANLHPKHRSSFRALFLSTVVKNVIVKHHGMNAVLKPLVDDINKLSSSGIEITRDGRKHRYKGALIAFLADDLASHTVGGFKQSMSFAKRFCRSCMATKGEACKKFRAEEFVLRTPQLHEAMCSDVLSDSFGNKSRLWN